MKVRFEEKAAVSSTALSVGDVSISAITPDVFCFVVFVSSIQWRHFLCLFFLPASSLAWVVWTWTLSTMTDSKRELKSKVFAEYLKKKDIFLFLVFLRAGSYWTPKSFACLWRLVTHSNKVYKIVNDARYIILIFIHCCTGFVFFSFLILWVNFDLIGLQSHLHPGRTLLLGMPS